MKRTKNFFLFLLTLLITGIIILIGYRFLSVAGNYFIMNDNQIKTYPLENNDSYVFYSQSDSDITLFPWNYAKTATPATELYSGTDEDGNVVESEMAKEFSSNEYLYERLRYYFYKTIPKSTKEMIVAADTSFYEIVDFSNIINFLSVKSASDTVYFFYDNTISIYGTLYELSFSFNDTLDICSFQCRLAPDEENLSADNLNFGAECLGNFIKYNNQYDLNYLVQDINSSNNSLLNYALIYIDADNIYINRNESKNEFYYYEAEDENYEYNYDYDTKADSHINNNVTNASYQIVKTNDELLLILVDSSIVLHFDPIQRQFTGFNYME